MSTVYIPYALGRHICGVFKEINFDTYHEIKCAIYDMRQLCAQKYSGNINIDKAVSDLRKELRQKHPKKAIEYINAKRKLEAFCSENSSILYRGEQLENDEHTRLSWILFGNTREQELSKHHNKYKHIYEQLFVLQQNVYTLEPFSVENIEDTIYDQTQALRRSLENENEAKLERWNKKHYQERKRLQAILNKARNFETLISNLSISDEKYIVGEAINIASGLQFYINEKSIFQHITIIR